MNVLKLRIPGYIVLTALGLEPMAFRLVSFGRVGLLAGDLHLSDPFIRGPKSGHCNHSFGH